MTGRRVTVAIVGCGRIGAQWDAELPRSSFSLTHASAFSRHELASLLAVCDSDPVKAQEAARHWGVRRSYVDARTMFAENAVELAVVATSSAARQPVIDAALAAGVKVLVVEKPLATTLTEAERLVRGIEGAGVKTVVNYSRHWDPSMLDLRRSIGAGEIGRLQRLVGTYGKGLTNNGSHLIDLAGLLCDARPVCARALGSPLEQSESAWSGGEDPAIDAEVDFVDARGSTVRMSMLATDHSAFTVFDLRVFGRDGMCEISRGGRSVTLTSIEADTQYAGYRIPGTPHNLVARGLEAMDAMADEALALALGARQRSSCDVHDAWQVALTVEAVKRSARDGGAWIEVGGIQSTLRGAS
jgi:predicted dehydrogenase